MQIIKTTEGSQTTLALIGRLDANTALELDEVVFSCITDTQDLIFDFAELSFISSAGLRILVKTLDAIENKGGTLVVRNVCDSIMEILEITSLNSLLTIE